MGVKIEGVARLKTKLAERAKKYGDQKESVTVGFTQRYALYVHEIQIPHKVGQWKYLETPARGLRNELSDMIKSGIARGLNTLQALMIAGLRLQRAAQLLTPVDTSALKASAFTCPSKDVETVSQSSFDKSEAIRLSEKNVKKIP